ncbi:hypothetical protein XBI1_1630003 [Xenorhabdus bovienii str. Intermedium]|uniref:Uncharacterized protein n=1 Tax=Xenorhabdus bovienii str. Intermedium TaxID=1379677 RepID=A0A077QE71_XENBV|nr:hypothetical protein XBI1_1630003 [Xenorhabdus bovienii str. Intermedium]
MLTLSVCTRTDLYADDKYHGYGFLHQHIYLFAESFSGGSSMYCVISLQPSVKFSAGKIASIR